MAVARVTLTCLFGGSVLQNVIHFRKPDYVTANLPVLLTSFRDMFLDQYRANTNAEMAFISVHGERVQSGGGGDIADLTLALMGTGGSDTRIPLQLAMVAQLKTGLAGRTNRGRIYLHGTTCNWLLNGVWNPTNLAGSQARMTTLVGRWCAGNSQNGWSLVILGKNAPDTDAKTVTDIQIRATPGTQRRRQVGVGI